MSLEIFYVGIGLYEIFIIDFLKIFKFVYSLILIVVLLFDNVIIFFFVLIV